VTPSAYVAYWLWDWCSGDTLVSHHYNQGLISGVSNLDGHMITKSDRWVFSG